MKIFKNANLTDQITVLDLGIVKAGDSKQFVFYILNNSNASLKDLIFVVEHSEVNVIEAPKELLPNENNKLIIEWNPSITLKEGLKTKLKITGNELWE